MAACSRDIACASAVALSASLFLAAFVVWWTTCRNEKFKTNSLSKINNSVLNRGLDIQNSFQKFGNKVSTTVQKAATGVQARNAAGRAALAAKAAESERAAKAAKALADAAAAKAAADAAAAKAAAADTATRRPGPEPTTTAAPIGRSNAGPGGQTYPWLICHGKRYPNEYHATYGDCRDKYNQFFEYKWHGPNNVAYAMSPTTSGQKTTSGQQTTSGQPTAGLTTNSGQPTTNSGQPTAAPTTRQPIKQYCSQNPSVAGRLIGNGQYEHCDGRIQNIGG